MEDQELDIHGHPEDMAGVVRKTGIAVARIIISNRKYAVKLTACTQTCSYSSSYRGTDHGGL